MLRKNSSPKNLPQRSLFPKKLAVLSSPYNKDIVVMSYLNGPCIWVDGIQQSGPYIFKMWTKVLKGVQKETISKVLIIGFGGGSAYTVVSKKYPLAKVTGIDIDSVIIGVARKYFGIEASPQLKMVIGDAKVELKKFRTQFDLIIVDLYLGGKSQLREDIIVQAKKLLKNEGIILCNLFGQNVLVSLPKELRIEKTIQYKKNYVIDIRHKKRY